MTTHAFILLAVFWLQTPTVAQHVPSLTFACVFILLSHFAWDSRMPRKTRRLHTNIVWTNSPSQANSFKKKGFAIENMGTLRKSADLG